jgi:predicted DNA-binding protein with PD1-like motif
MPYITKDRRKLFENGISELGELATVDGDFNYIFSALIHKFIEKNGLKYNSINAAIGVLECAKLELYRQIAAKYEDKKILENGKVSNLD